MLRVEEALQLFSSFYGEAASIEMLLERFGLAEKRRAFFETLSGGQKQRLALARFLGSRLFPLASLRRGPRGRGAGGCPRSGRLPFLLGLLLQLAHGGPVSEGGGVSPNPGVRNVPPQPAPDFCAAHV